MVSFGLGLPSCSDSPDSCQSGRPAFSGRRSSHLSRDTPTRKVTIRNFSEIQASRYLGYPHDTGRDVRSPGWTASPQFLGFFVGGLLFELVIITGAGLLLLEEEAPADADSMAWTDSW